MTHERCSELLTAYVRGELASAAADEVREHLSGCAECRAEERAVALMAGPPGEPMDDVERARLHRGLAQELFATPANADVAGAGGGPPRWTRWLAPVAAAAAVVAGIAVMTTGGGSDDAATVQEFSGAAEDGGGGGDNTADAAGAAPESDGKPGKDSRSLSAVRGQAAGAAAPQARPEFDADAGTLTAEDLSDIGRSGDLFRTFADTVSPADGPGLYDDYLSQLAGAAGGVRSEVEECAATLPQDGSLIPVYGALAEYDDRSTLVLGFATSDPGSKELDRYLMWVWERGNCRQPVYTVFENIER